MGLDEISHAFVGNPCYECVRFGEAGIKGTGMRSAE